MAVTTRIGGTNVTTAHAARWSASMLSAFIASQVGGVLMALTLAGWFVVADNATLLHPLRVIATFRYGERAMYELTTSGFLWAAAFHAGVCAAWGILFGFLATTLRVDKSLWGPTVLGLAIGLGSQIVDVNIVTPVAMEALHGHDLWADHVPPAASWAAHLAFGLGFSSFTPIFRRLWLRWVGRGDLLAGDPRLT